MQKKKKRNEIKLSSFVIKTKFKLFVLISTVLEKKKLFTNIAWIVYVYCANDNKLHLKSYYKF